MSLISKIKSAYKKVKQTASSAVSKAKSLLTPSPSTLQKSNPLTGSANDAFNSAFSASKDNAKFNPQNQNTVTAQSYGVQYGPERAPEVGVKSYGVQYGPQPDPVKKTISAGKQNVGGGSNQVNNNLSAAYQAPTTLTSTALRTSSGTGTSPSSGGSTSVVTLPSSPGSTNPQVDNTQLAGSTAGLYERQPDGTFKLVEQKEQTVEDKVKDRAKLMEDYLGVKESVYDDREVKRAQKERQRIQQAIQAPMAELNAVVAKQNTDLLAHRKMVSDNGGTETGFGGIESAINYNAAIRALPLKASIASLQGELELAQDYLQELVTVKTDQINRQYEYRKQVFSSIEGILDTEDKRAYDKITKENDRAYAEEQDLIKTQFALSQMVMQNAPESVRTNVINRINAAPTKQAALQAAGQYGLPSNTEIIQLPDGRDVLINKETGDIVKTIGSDSTSTKVDSYKFTSSQVNKGANNAGLKLSEFNELPSDVKNYYISSTKTELDAIEEVITNIKNGDEDAEDVKNEIDNSNATDDVKAHLKDRIDKIAPEEKESGWEKVWNFLTGKKKVDEPQVKGFLDSKPYRFEFVDENLESEIPTLDKIEIPETSRLAKVNNNPGNLKYAEQIGAVKGEKGFARFANPAEGFKALIRQVKLDTSRGHTLLSFIKKFAPPSENDTKRYIDFVAKHLGIKPTTKLTDIDSENLAAAVALFESGTKVKK